MSGDIIGRSVPALSSSERAALVGRALSDAARKARFSTKRRRALSGPRARRGELLLRAAGIWTFVGIVLVPSVAFAIYIFLVASPQFVSEARFTIRGGMPAGLDQMSKLTGAPAMLIVQDTQVILNYLQSRSIVEALRTSVDLDRLYQRSSIDRVSRLKPDQPIEDVVKYWKRHLALSVQMPSGIVTFAVRAFSPDDSVRIARAALHASERLVNAMNDKMRDDAVRLAEIERRRAQDNLAAARVTLERARNEEGLLSAADQSSALTGLVQIVQAQMIKAQQEYDSQRRYVRADAPQLRNLQVRIEGSQREIAELKAQMTRSDGSRRAPGDAPVLSASMSRLDQAKLENTVAEKIYAASLAGLEQARVASESKLIYLNAFVQPVAAQRSDRPTRGLDMLVFVLASGGVWGAIVAGLRLASTSLA